MAGEMGDTAFVIYYITLEHSQSFPAIDTDVTLSFMAGIVSVPFASPRIATGSPVSEQDVPMSKFPVDPRSRRGRI